MGLLIAGDPDIALKYWRGFFVQKFWQHVSEVRAAKMESMIDLHRETVAQNFRAWQVPTLEAGKPSQGRDDFAPDARTPASNGF